MPNFTGILDPANFINSNPRLTNRILPVDIARRVDSYAASALNDLEALLSEKAFTDTIGSLNPLEFNTAIQKDIADIIEDIKGIPPPLAPGGYSLEGKIDQDGNTGLFIQVSDKIAGSSLTFNTNVFLEKRAIKHFLFGYAFYNIGLNDVNAIVKFMTDEKAGGGIQPLYTYIVETSIDKIIVDERIVVSPPILLDLKTAAKEANISFIEGTFYAELKKLFDKFVFASNELAIINAIAPYVNPKVASAETALLIDFIKQSKIKIDAANANFLLLPELQRIRSIGIQNFPSGSSVSDTDFLVDYFHEDSAALEINRDNVLCAAQLYFVMTIGDEMDVFNVVHRIATKYLTTGAVDIRSRALLEDLQLYVFSERFRDLRTNKEHQRLQLAELRMFQSQVFGVDHRVKLGEGMVINEEFGTLWETLMYETAKYLHKVEKSENPQFFVSRQNIAQASEDILYNLSNHCTGMTKVMAPLANRELDFVMKRFLQNDEIIRQIAPRNSNSVWKVIERILQEWKGKSTNVVALRNKAVYGHMILQSIANYSTSMIDNDAEFSRFVNTIEAFIIANSQLEGQGERRELAYGEEEDYAEMTPSNNGSSNGIHGAKIADDWDF